MNNELYNAYVGVQDFTLRHAAFLILGVEKVTKGNRMRVNAIYGQLKNDAKEGLLPVDLAGTYQRTSWLVDMGRRTEFKVDWPSSKVTRDDLMSWCLERGLAPEFLFGTVDTDIIETVPQFGERVLLHDDAGVSEQIPKKAAYKKPTMQAMAFAEFLAHVVKNGGYTPENLPFNAVTLIAVFNKDVVKKYHVTVKDVPGFVSRNRTLFCEKLGVTDIAFAKNTQNRDIMDEIKNLLEKNPFKPKS